MLSVFQTEYRHFKLQLAARQTKSPMTCLLPSLNLQFTPVLLLLIPGLKSPSENFYEAVLAYGWKKARFLRKYFLFHSLFLYLNSCSDFLKRVLFKVFYYAFFSPSIADEIKKQESLEPQFHGNKRKKITNCRTSSEHKI